MPALNQNQFALSNVKGLQEMRNGQERISCLVDGTESLVAGDFVEITQKAGKAISVKKLAAQANVVFGVVAFTFKDAVFKVGSFVEVVAISGIVVSEAAGAIARWGKVGPMLAGMKVVAQGVATTAKFTLQFVATAGTFKLTVNGFTTADLAYNISAANLQVAIRALDASLNASTVALVGSTYSVDTTTQVVIAVSLSDVSLVNGIAPVAPVLAITSQGQAGTGLACGRSLDIASKDGDLVRIAYFVA